ncbi:MAG TPA: hypothetical protein VE955_07035, partial [Candidatus Dormibacteraeota bacterium]|nr:hypothetical protein [Candidatus Dormibacteraeota bacterium]
PRKRGKKSLPKGEVPDAVYPPAGCRFHPRCPAVLETCGWEGRDFIDYLEERELDSAKREEDERNLGSLEKWMVKGLEARKKMEKFDSSKVVSYLRNIIAQARPQMAQAVQDVSVEGGQIVVRFRKPDHLGPKEIEGRLVECLLY